MNIRKIFIIIIILSFSIKFVDNVVAAESHPGEFFVSHDTSLSTKLHFLTNPEYKYFKDLTNNVVLEKNVESKYQDISYDPTITSSNRTSYFTPFERMYFNYLKYPKYGRYTIQTFALKNQVLYKATASYYQDQDIVIQTIRTRGYPVEKRIKVPSNIFHINKLLFNLSNNSLIVFDDNNNGHVLDILTGTFKESFKTNVFDPNLVELSQDGRWLIIPGEESIQILDTEHSFQNVINNELKNYFVEYPAHKIYFDNTGSHLFAEVSVPSTGGKKLSVINFPTFKLIEERSLSNDQEIEMNEDRTILTIRNPYSKSFISTEGFFSEYKSIRISPSNILVSNNKPINLKVEGIKPDNTVVTLPLQFVNFSIKYNDDYGKYEINSSKQLIPIKSGIATLKASYKGMHASAKILPTKSGFYIPLSVEEVPFNSKEIFGKTLPNADLEITLTNSSNVKLVKYTTSNEDGYFNLTLEKSFSQKFSVQVKAIKRITVDSKYPNIHNLNSAYVSKNNISKPNNWQPVINRLNYDAISNTSTYIKGYTIPFATVTIKTPDKTRIVKADKLGKFIADVDKELFNKAGKYVNISVVRTGYSSTISKNIQITKDLTEPTIKWSNIFSDDFTLVGKTEPYTIVEIIGQGSYNKGISDKDGNIRIRANIQMDLDDSPYYWSATDQNGNRTPYTFLQY